MLHNPRHQALEESRVVDIAMEDFRHVLVVENALLPGDQIEHDTGIALDAPDVLRAPLLLQFDPLELP